MSLAQKCRYLWSNFEVQLASDPLEIWWQLLLLSSTTCGIMTPVYGPLHSASNLPTIAFQTQPCPVPPIQFEFKLLISLIPFLNVWPDAMNSNGGYSPTGGAAAFIDYEFGLRRHLAL